MADTYTYSGGANTYFKYKTHKLYIDDFSVVADMPVENTTPVGSSLGNAGSAGIVKYSGSFSGRFPVKGKTTGGWTDLLASSVSVAPTSAVIKCSSITAYKGKVLLSNVSIDAAGGSVVKASFAWTGCGGFDFATST